MTDKPQSVIDGWGLWPKQALAFYSQATELYFGGASEGGKSYLGRYALIAWCAAIENLQCFIFRKYYGDVISNHMEGPSSFKQLLAPWIRKGLVRTTENSIRFTWNNSIIQMHGIAHNKDLEKHIGREKHVLWIEEAGQIPKRHIDGLRAWVRMPEQMKLMLADQLRPMYPHLSDEERKALFPRILYTSNPEGPSLGFFRRQFVAGREPMSIWTANEKDGGFVRQFIPSRVTDNPSADEDAQRKRLLPLGEARARALIEGDHDAPTGDFYPEYDDEVHSVDDFTPPKHWFKYRTFDWGSSDPFAAYWWAVSDGEEFMDDNGNKRWFPSGALIAYREWYGCLDDDPSKGLNMRNEDIATGIVHRTQESVSGITLTDNFPFADRGGSKGGIRYTMADTFFEEGCPLTLGNTARVYGWKQLRSRLQGVDRVPMIYFTKSCSFARDYIPALGYHESEHKTEDAQESGEATHACDAIRLACTARPLVVKKKDEDDPDWDNTSRQTPKSILKKLRRGDASKIRYG